MIHRAPENKWLPSLQNPVPCAAMLKDKTFFWVRYFGRFTVT